MPRYTILHPGEPAPWFHVRANTRADYAFETSGGSYCVLCFFATADERGKAAVDAAMARPDLFDDEKALFFGVSIDPADEAKRRVACRLPGFRFFWDFDGAVSKLYGAIPDDASPGKADVRLRRIWVIIDPTMRVLKVVPFAQDGSDAQEVIAYVSALPPPYLHAGFEVQAPVLILPNVFEAEFADKLIALHEAHGSAETGFMREVDGNTVQVHDYAHKRRRDHMISDEGVMEQIRRRLSRSVVPEILKVHQYRVTRLERYLVGCYTAEDSGHFAPHRDNTTKGTAHRRFAVSVNLNADFDGGEVSFPEYGPRRFKPPPGGAVVFSCSLLHTVSKVTRGRRYAFLPFMYDDEGAKIRQENSKFLEDGSTA